MYIWFDFDASFITYYFFLLIGGKDKDKKGGDKDKAKGAESKDHIILQGKWGQILGLVIYL